MAEALRKPLTKQNRSGIQVPVRFCARRKQVLPRIGENVAAIVLRLPCCGLASRSRLYASPRQGDATGARPARRRTGRVPLGSCRRAAGERFLSGSRASAARTKVLRSVDGYGVLEQQSAVLRGHEPRTLGDLSRDPQLTGGTAGPSTP